MRIRDVFLLEAYYDDLQVAIMDRLAQYLGKEVNEIPTDETLRPTPNQNPLLQVEPNPKLETKLDWIPKQNWREFFRHSFP